MRRGGGWGIPRQFDLNLAIAEVSQDIHFDFARWEDVFSFDGLERHSFPDPPQTVGGLSFHPHQSGHYAFPFSINPYISGEDDCPHFSRIETFRMDVERRPNLGRYWFC